MRERKRERRKTKERVRERSEREREEREREREMSALDGHTEVSRCSPWYKPSRVREVRFRAVLNKLSRQVRRVVEVHPEARQKFDVNVADAPFHRFAGASSSERVEVTIDVVDKNFVRDGRHDCVLQSLHAWACAIKTSIDAPPVRVAASAYIKV